MTNQSLTDRNTADSQYPKRGTRDRRTRIIAAARSLLAEEGYDRVTMKRIAGAAGVAQGLIHYYFSGKEEILIEVLMDASREYVRETERLAASLPGGERLSEAALAESRARVSRMPEWYRLRYELFAMGLRTPEFRSGVANLLANGRAGIVATLSRMAGQSVPESGTDAEPAAIAAVLLACFDGLALQKLADPDGFDLEAAYAVLARMAEGVITES